MTDAPPSDEALMRAAQGGDGEALGLLFERYARTLRLRIARRLPGHLARKVSVADLLQETRLLLLQHHRGFEDRGDGSFRAWLLTIVDRKVRDVVRKHLGTAKRGARREVSRGQRVDTANFVADGPSPSEAAIASELADLARAAIETLPRDYREVLRLAREEQLSLRDVAERMGRSRDAVKKLYWRALRRFKEAYEGGKRDG